MRLCAVQFFAVIGNIEANLKNILAWIAQARSVRAQAILFPECALSGYLPLDHLFEPEFQKQQTRALQAIAAESQGLHILIGAALPVLETDPLKFYNAYVHCFEGKMQGFVAKTRLPNDDIFQDSRFFIPNPQPGKSNLITLDSLTLGVGICEDMWNDARLFEQIYAAGKPHLWVCPSASPFSVGKAGKRKEQMRCIIQKTHLPFLFLNQVASYDGIIFEGHSYLLSDQQKILGQLRPFREEALVFDINPPDKLARAQIFVTQKSNFKKLTQPPAKKYRQRRIETLVQALEFGTRNFIQGCGLSKAIICVSGGLDSAVALLITKRALGAKACLSLILPSRHNKTQSTLDAIALCTSHQIAYRTLSIEPFYKLFRNLCFREFGKDTQSPVFENLQARIRGVIAMMFTNQETACLIGTSNKSELTMGYATLYGDLCAGLLVIGDLLKSQIYSVAHYYQEIGEFIPEGILKRPPSAELTENQKDTDTLPPYDQLDPAIDDYLRHELSKHTGQSSNPLWPRIRETLHRSQFKRKQTAPVLKVSHRDLSRGRQVIISGGHDQKGVLAT